MWLRSTCPQRNLLGQSARRSCSTYQGGIGCKQRGPELHPWPSRFLHRTRLGWRSPAHSICPWHNSHNGPRDLLQLRRDIFPQGRVSLLKFLMQRSMTRQGRRGSVRVQWLPALFCTCQGGMQSLRKHPVRTTTRAGTSSTLSGQTHWRQGCRYPVDTESPTQPDNTCPPGRPCTGCSRRLQC